MSGLNHPDHSGATMHSTPGAGMRRLGRDAAGNQVWEAVDIAGKPDDSPGAVREVKSVRYHGHSCAVSGCSNVGYGVPFDWKCTDHLVEKPDLVNHPPHYTAHPSGIECIQVTEHMNFNLGNAMKYIWRADHKHGIQDLKKAVFYLNREIARLQ